MDYANPTEIWWPSPSAFDDLSVDYTEQEDGSLVLHLEAPDDTECADWLNYFNQTPERHDAFERAFMQSLREHLNRVQNGQTQNVSNEQDSDCPRDQENGAGSVEEH